MKTLFLSLLICGFVFAGVQNPKTAVKFDPSKQNKVKLGFRVKPVLVGDASVSPEPEKKRVHKRRRRIRPRESTFK